MQGKKRYILIFLSCAFLVYCYLGGYRLKSKRVFSETKLPSYFDVFNDQLFDQDYEPSALTRRHFIVPRLANTRNVSYLNCRMDTCFDYSKCSGDFKVYVYSIEEEESAGYVPTPSYQKILNVILESRYYTSDPSKACLFVLALDTLDRDSLSEGFTRKLQERFQKIRKSVLWNGGKNHIIFNLYSGTWPDYFEDDLGFDPGMAILAKASMSTSWYRQGFDISLPLFSKDHPEKGGEPGLVTANNFPVNKKFLLAFKGKRYVHGIGSETRNSLYHLHNGKDTVLITTCQHGKSWKELKDDRCDEDQLEYEKYDYKILLENATFCLVPRGRRLGSYRFLESLQAGCIPVLLSNGWVLPFSQVIDWNKASIQADERLLLQVPDMIRSIDPVKTLSLRQQTQILWDLYFSSIEKIVFTTFEIIRERIPSFPSRGRLVWNSNPGALVMLPNFSDTWREYPFYMDVTNVKPSMQFTAVIYSQMGGTTTGKKSLLHLMKNVAQSQYISRIVIVWSSEKVPPPPRTLLPSTHLSLPVSIIHQGSTNSGVIEIPSQLQRGISQRFYPHNLIQTDAVLSLDEDCLLTTDEIDFAFTVWRAFPDRIVGYPARSHYWDDSKASWGYTSKWTNDYSLVLTGAAFYHRYYNYLYTMWLSPLLHKTVEQSQNCEDILMNFLVAHVTRRPPIKVSRRKQYKEQPPDGPRSPWNDFDHFVQRQTCLNTFAAVFGYMPLLRSNMRLDPVLFKDPVSNRRKKYKQIELVGV